MVYYLQRNNVEVLVQRNLNVKTIKFYTKEKEMKLKKILSALFAATVVCGMIAVNASAAEPEDGLLVYYSFDDASDLGADNSGNGHDAQADGGLTASEGMVGGAAKFDGTTADLLVENTGITGLKMFTISAWVKLADAERGDLVSFVSGHNWSDVGSMHCCFKNDGGLAVDVDYMWNAWLSSNTSSEKINNGKWTLITIVFDAEEGWVWTYFNGRMVNEVGFIGGENGVNFDNFTIGGWSNNGAVGRFFNGEIDEFKLYGKTFNADEVKAMAGEHYEAPTTETTSEPTESTKAPETDDKGSTESKSQESVSGTNTKAPASDTEKGGSDGKNETPVGLIIGIVAVVVAVIVVVVVIVTKKKKK